MAVDACLNARSTGEAALGDSEESGRVRQAHWQTKDWMNVIVEGYACCTVGFDCKSGGLLRC